MTKKERTPAWVGREVGWIKKVLGRGKYDPTLCIKLAKKGIFFYVVSRKRTKAGEMAQQVRGLVM